MRNLLKMFGHLLCIFLDRLNSLRFFDSLRQDPGSTEPKKPREITKFTGKNGSAVGFTMTSVDLIFAVHPGL